MSATESDSRGSRTVKRSERCTDSYFSGSRFLQCLSNDSEFSYSLRREYSSMVLNPLRALQSRFDGDELVMRTVDGLYEGRGRPVDRVGRVIHQRTILDAWEEECGVEEIFVVETKKALALRWGLLSLGRRTFTVRADPLRKPLFLEDVSSKSLLDSGRFYEVMMGRESLRENYAVLDGTLVVLPHQRAREEVEGSTNEQQ